MTTNFRIREPYALTVLQNSVVISDTNSITTPISANGVFTGQAEDVSKYSHILISIYTDQDSASRGLSVQFSVDGVNWDFNHIDYIEANVKFTKTYRIAAKYFRIVYTNGTISQTEMRAISMLNPYHNNPPIEDSVYSIYGELKTTERSPVISLKSVYGLSNLRDRVSVTGSGVVEDTFTTGTGEYRVATTANASDRAQLFSANRGLYQPGFSASAGIGVRIPTDMTGNQEAMWGLGEDPYEVNSNGLYYGQDSTGIFIAIRRNGTTTKTYQTDWNVDSVDGTCNSGLTLSLNRGNIFHIDFNWYGYGLIKFIIYISNTPNNREKSHTLVHVFRPEGSTSIVNPNLPIITSLNNSTTALSREIFVGGRQYSITGKTEELNRRITAERRNFTISYGTTIVPLVSFRRKTAYLTATCRVIGFDIVNLGANDIYAETRMNGSLTGASWGTPTNYTVTETAVESDNSATAITGGDVLWVGLIKAGERKTSSFDNLQPAQTDLIQTFPISLCIAATTGTNTGVTVVFRIVENW